MLLWMLTGHFTQETDKKEPPVIEPDYQDLLYGSIWRHTIFSPHISHEVLDAEKHLRDFIGARYPELISMEKHLRCISHHVLWYSSTDKSPLVLDSYVQDKEGHKHPVSVPVSLGNTFNFLLVVGNNNTSSTHAFTITESIEHKFYLYSHIFYSITDQLARQKTECICNCEREKHRSHNVLSMLALSKSSQLYSENNCILSEKSEHMQDTHMTSFHGSVRQPAQSSEVKDKRAEWSKTTISVMTYNIWNFNAYKYSTSYNDYVERCQRILQILHETQPDIAGFQEVRFEQASGGKFGPNQVEHLLSALPGYQFVYQPAQLMPDSLHSGRTEEGVAIFSRFPIVHHDYLLLFRNRLNSADQHQRICLHAVIHVPYIGRIHVFNTHLSLSHEAREESVAQIIEFIREIGEDEPALLMGDLNATPDEKAIRMLSEASNLVDTWDRLYPSSNGFTFNNLDDQLSKRVI
ncbi:endonuclease/exonuclease/phosphatase [Elysia marginata]|uniref:Endonuclease/exonuclease/phosphatase n=1 Tax=Elysia marginata TaxID=1093978 RepID=A0AAV4I962_9GAST|nr:endonuclease/exonuclease/phosphatase [Elysia marginata]